VLCATDSSLSASRCYQLYCTRLGHNECCCSHACASLRIIGARCGGARFPTKRHGPSRSSTEKTHILGAKTAFYTHVHVHNQYTAELTVNTCWFVPRTTNVTLHTNLRICSLARLIEIEVPIKKHDQALHLVKARMILAEMCRKKMEAMNDSERTKTMNGSLQME
jgi:hypothetical protein